MFELEHLQQMTVQDPQLQYLESHSRKTKEQHQHTVESERQYESQIQTVNELVS